jgi:adenosine kinase
MTDSSKATGTCACLITGQGKDRSLVAYLGAANNYHANHLLLPQVQERLTKSQVIYITGFFLTVSPETIMKVAQLSASSGDEKVFCMNLSAPFICRLFKDPMNKALEYVDFLFGNEEEALAYAESNKMNETDVEEIAKRLSLLPKVPKNRPRTVIITQGSQPAIVSINGAIHATYPAIPMAPSEIVDTNGAGDAFVGGFLSQLVQGKSIEACVNAGHYLANIIIKRLGITFPDHPPKLDF